MVCNASGSLSPFNSDCTADSRSYVVVISTEQSFEFNFAGDVLGIWLDPTSMDASVVLVQPTNKRTTLPIINFLSTSKGYSLKLDLLEVLRRINVP